MPPPAEQPQPRARPSGAARAELAFAPGAELGRSRRGPPMRVEWPRSGDQVREHRCRRRARDAQPERQRLRADPPVDAHRSSPSMGNSKGLVACAPRRRRRYSPYVGEVYVAPGNTCLDERDRHRFAASQTGCGSQASRNSASPPASAPLAGDQLLQRNARRLVHRHAPERGACQLIAPAGLLAACVW